MRKIFALAFTVTLTLLVLVGCGSNQVSSQVENETKLTSEELNIDGDYIITIEEIEFAKDAENKDAITISYKLTNNTSEPIQWNGYFWAYVFQDGVQIETTTFPSDDSDPSSIDRQVKDGATIIVKDQYLLSNNTSTVDVILHSYFNKDTLAKTFNLQ